MFLYCEFDGSVGEILLDPSEESALDSKGGKGIHYGECALSKSLSRSRNATVAGLLRLAVFCAVTRSRRCEMASVVDFPLMNPKIPSDLGMAQFSLARTSLSIILDREASRDIGLCLFPPGLGIGTVMAVFY